jgi:hypothetical protein
VVENNTAPSDANSFLSFANSTTDEYDDELSQKL